MAVGSDMGANCSGSRGADTFRSHGALAATSGARQQADSGITLRLRRHPLLTRGARQAVGPSSCPPACALPFMPTVAFAPSCASALARLCGLVNRVAELCGLRGLHKRRKACRLCVARRGEKQGIPDPGVITQSCPDDSTSCREGCDLWRGASGIEIATGRIAKRPWFPQCRRLGTTPSPRSTDTGSGGLPASAPTGLEVCERSPWPGSHGLRMYANRSGADHHLTLHTGDSP